MNARMAAILIGIVFVAAGFGLPDEKREASLA
jgi:hypothetical protein